MPLTRMRGRLEIVSFHFISQGSVLHRAHIISYSRQIKIDCVGKARYMIINLITYVGPL